MKIRADLWGGPVGVSDSLALLEPQRLKVNEKVVRINYPLLLWIRPSVAVETCLCAELFNFPTLYGLGKTTEEAVERLLEVMFGFFQDTKDIPEEKCAGPALKMKTVLDKIFGETVTA